MKSFNIAIVILSLILISFNASAEVAARDPGSAAAAKAQMMLRQIAADRDALKTENASLQAEIEKLQKQVDSLKNEKKRLSSKINNAGQTIDKYSEVNEKLRERITKDRERTKEMIVKFKETVRTLKQVEQQRAQLDTNFTSVKQELSKCTKDNVELYNTNLELVDLYKEKSVWDALVQQEPVTQIGRVKIENIGQEYANKMQDFRFASNIVEE